MKEKWIETKREVEQNKIGEIVKTTIVRERVEPGWKSVIDTGLKLLGISAIFIPLFLFYRQQQVDRENQMINQKSEVYSNLSISLHSLGEQISTYIFDSIPTSNYNLIMFKLIPKALLFDDSNFKKCLVDLRFKTQVYFQISKYIFHCHQIRE